MKVSPEVKTLITAQVNAATTQKQLVVRESWEMYSNLIRPPPRRVYIYVRGGKGGGGKGGGGGG